MAVVVGQALILHRLLRPLTFSLKACAVWADQPFQWGKLVRWQVNILVGQMAMEKKAIEGLRKQWEGIQALGEVLDALRQEERAGVDLGELAVKELEKYAADNAELKRAAATAEEQHSSQLDEMKDELRSQQDKLREQEHAHSLEVRGACTVDQPCRCKLFTPSELRVV